MLILHHYPMSPFSEKLRAICGLLDIEWLSVITTESPPRPLLDQLAGGYRRIPVAQWGADVVCDTRLICTELARRHQRPELDPTRLDADDLAYAERLDGEVFWAAVTSIPARRVLAKLFKELPFLQALRFIRDRAGVARHARTPPLPPATAVTVFAEHLRELEQRLADGKPFLAGSEPGYLDFTAYHTLWFQCEVGGIPMPEPLRRVPEWYRRVSGFGYGQPREGSAEDAREAATAASPAQLEGGVSGDIAAGTPVEVMPVDYALDATAGALVARDADRVVIAREDEQLGSLHVHFPATGFEVTQASNS